MDSPRNPFPGSFLVDGIARVWRRRPRRIPPALLAALWSRPGVARRAFGARMVRTAAWIVLALTVLLEVLFFAGVVTYPGLLKKGLDPGAVKILLGGTSVAVVVATGGFLLIWLAAHLESGWLRRRPKGSHERVELPWERWGAGQDTRTPWGRMLHNLYQPKRRHLLTVIVLSWCIATCIGGCIVWLFVFPGLVIWGIYRAFQETSFGSVRVEFVGAPYRPGDRVRVVFHALGAGTIFRNLEMSMGFRPEKRNWFAAGRWRRWVPWVSTARRLTDVTVPEPQSAVEVDFRLPDDAPIPFVGREDTGFWELRVNGDGVGVKFGERFAVPVVAREGTVPAVTDTPVWRGPDAGSPAPPS